MQSSFLYLIFKVLSRTRATYSGLFRHASGSRSFSYSSLTKEGIYGKIPTMFVNRRRPKQETSQIWLCGIMVTTLTGMALLLGYYLGTVPPVYSIG
jgi:hypothetical protein